jgi:hypothetical protein
MRQTWFWIIIMTVCSSCAITPSEHGGAQPSIERGTVALASSDRPIAPGKFIPTFAIDYGPLKSSSLEEAARFDLIDAGAHSVADGNTWVALKKLNPNIKVFVYQLGPSEYGVSKRSKFGNGWNWITVHHGFTSQDRWTAVGAIHGYYLQGRDYEAERLMLIGNPAWQQYWLDTLFRTFWSRSSPNRFADGVFADNTNYRLPSESGWYRQGHPDQPDVPAEYSHNGWEQADNWEAQAKEFFAKGVPWLAERGVQLMPNFGYMALYPENWVDLDSMPQPVFAGMEEGAFATPWGGHGSFVFYSEAEWLNQVNTLRQLKHVRALMLVHGMPPTTKPSFSRIDARDANGVGGWDALWFGLMSFLQGYDDVRQNAYFGFTVWGYGRAYWLDEFDPGHLNLGRALGESHRVDGAVGHCYAREFDAGWAVVNPTDAVAQNVAVPEGQARVLNHDNFEHAEGQALVSRFDLAAHRGVVLLKAGRQVGNMDNTSAGGGNVR